MALLEPLIPKEKWGRPLEIDMCAAINRPFYLVKSGFQWDNPPKEYPMPSSVYCHDHTGCFDDTWEQMNSVLREQARLAKGRAAQPSAAVIDSQSVKPTEAGGERGFDGGKLVKGRKRHFLVDTLGNLLKVICRPAHLSDQQGAQLLLQELPEALWERLERFWADDGYCSDSTAWVQDNFQGLHSDTLKGFVVLPKRWIVDRTFVWFGRCRQVSKEYD